MADIDELSQLEELLSADFDEKPLVKSLDREVNISENIDVNDELTTENHTSGDTALTSVVHSGDTDSSDDEEKRNYTERKYNDYGSQIKKSLDQNENEKINNRLNFETRLRNTNLDVKVTRSKKFSQKPNIIETVKQFSPPDIKTKTPSDLYTDPIFGIRITKPLISSNVMLDRMQGREAVSMLRVKRYVENDDLTKDWVVGGVIVKKSLTKKSQKGSNFLIWTLCDLKDDLKTVSIFLFKKAYNELWKTTEGTVVAVLNPNVLDKSQNTSDQACLSVDTSERIMVLGQSKDFGICKSKKKNGEPCTSFVNINKCEHCIYHVKQEYQKFSRRQELQSSTMGKGLVNLQKKVLGKDTVIYGGKTYSALTVSNNKVVKQKDQNRLMTLSDYYKSDGDQLMMNKAPYGAGAIKNNSVALHSPVSLKLNDSERLGKLGSGLQSNKASLFSPIAKSSKLSNAFSLKGSGTIDLNALYGEKAAERSKANAFKLIQKSGGLSKLDPNNIRGTEAGKKRSLDNLNLSGSAENTMKKPKQNQVESKMTKGVMSERFKKILEASSAHQNLIEQHEDDEKEKYFNKLEKKEAMEEKMLNTFKLACKAVRCVKCKYTAFSASQLCKDERHPLKVIDTHKRFFKCADCKNRTVSLDLIPLHSCSNCKGSRWEKAAMLREKNTLSNGLSLRGEEETFIGGQVSTGKNINLLVPDS